MKRSSIPRTVAADLLPASFRAARARGYGLNLWAGKHEGVAFLLVDGRVAAVLEDGRPRNFASVPFWLIAPLAADLTVLG